MLINGIYIAAENEIMLMFDGLDLRHLRALDALLDERHVSRAADRLALTQPAVSNSLARLRDHFGDELLVRDGPRLVATPFADSIQKALRNVLLEVHAVTSARPGFNPTGTHKFSVLMPDHVAGLVLPLAIRRLAAASPTSQLTCWTPTDETRAAFDKGEFDLAILPQPTLADRHPSEEIFSEDWVYIARSEHPVALEANPEQLAAMLRVEPFVPRWQGGEPAKSAATVSVGLLPSIVAGTDLIAITPRSFAEFHARTQSIVILAASTGRPPSHYYAQWHIRRETDPVSRWFRDILRAAAAGLFENITI